MPAFYKDDLVYVKSLEIVSTISSYVLNQTLGRESFEIIGYTLEDCRGYIFREDDLELYRGGRSRHNVEDFRKLHSH